MHAKRELDLCLKLLAQTASDQGDGMVSALMLQDRMERHGLCFEALLDHLCRHEDDYAYQAENFFSLIDRAQAAWEAADSFPTDGAPSQVSFSLVVVAASAAPVNVTVDDPDDKVSQESRADRIKVQEHNRKSRKGKPFTVRTHWRQRRCSTRQSVWRNDPAASPGDDYEWIGSHCRWYCHAGKGRKIRVRGYWRLKPATTVRKAA